MRSINLCSYVDGFKTLGKDQFKSYLEHFGIEVKEQEGKDIFTFVTEVLNLGVDSDQLSDFFVGYTIPQISKEFDLLRIGDNYTLDIELKNISSEEKIKKQLTQNNYYLKALGVPVEVFAYVVRTQEVYKLDQDGNLIKSSLAELAAAIEGQKHKNIADINLLFKPSEYLVSPLNSTDKFMAGSYFLNDSQLSAKKKIEDSFKQKTAVFNSIEGRPGTGKTLVTYDIAKHFIEQRWNVIIFHCGMLAGGHFALNQNHGWNIEPIKKINDALTGSTRYDLVIIDEAQRIYSTQLETVIHYVRNNQAKCIFSYDPDQVFSASESSCSRIEQVTNDKHSLSEKVRTNKELAAFIINLFDRGKSNPNFEYKNIHIQYFDSANFLRDYLYQLKDSGWEVIKHTSSSYNLLTYDEYQVGRHNAHTVIGQEFDKVVAVINQHFYYDSAGKLMSVKESGAPGYRLDKMLYQMLTRARQEIVIAIYKNQPMLDACLKILGRKGS